MRHWRPFPGSLCLLASHAGTGDSSAYAEEQALAAIAHPLRRRQSLAVRELARIAMRELGAGPVGIGRRDDGSPEWPAGWVGSLAHDPQWSVALLASSSRYAALGVDVEPLLPLPEDAARLVIGRKERAHLEQLPDSYARWSRALFGAKECVHKALNPLTGVFLEFDEVEIVFDVGDGSHASAPSFRVIPVSAAASSAAQVCGRVWFTDAVVVTAAAVLARRL
ncbi:MAG: hypothetical protein JWQ90_1703 [Hydrocarboniphaga sp.]|uniref:4'-phosphopantetheinyl transferase family protein n=1 Tax=Hydrocarboniphaga sp. TaxID=2033016 RepID=UPI00263626E4|nr:4'-phosphopantetheinyl transferase superfamily protein [Hydrocarboniphaga sp.]MDB5969253.1 hypothetical protein [Hydrocarboniphaga sp.]